MIDATAIQALSSPLQAINQTLPIIQQQTEDIAISIKAVHHEAEETRQDAQFFRDKVLEDLTDLVDRVDSSSNSLENTIAMTFSRQSDGMNRLSHELRFAHAQDTGKLFAKLEAMVGIREAMTIMC